MLQPAKYINPFTDYGFKRLFGEEMNKDLLKDFLNELLYEEQGTITDLQYLKNEQLGNTGIDRKAIFDLYCTNEKGEKFIVELQKSKQKFFKDRALYYATFPIQEQAERGKLWDFQLKPIYTIAILDFVFDDDKDDNKYRYDVKLTELETCHVFYDNLTFIYLAMPKFTKTLEELETRFDKWLYVLKNLSQLQDIPPKLQERIFMKLFRSAEIAQFNREEYQSYENSLKYYWDLGNSLDTAREEGLKEGLEQGWQQGLEQGMEAGIKQGIAQGERKQQQHIALELQSMGLAKEAIAKATGLSLDDLESLL